MRNRKALITTKLRHNNCMVLKYSFKIKIAKSLKFSLLASSLTILSGCGPEGYRAPSNSEIGPETVRITSDSPVVKAPGDEVVSRLNSPDAKPILRKTESSDPEDVRVLKADIYFKFEWAKRVLDNNVVPLDIQTVIDDVRSRAEPLRIDRGSMLIKDILDLLQEGADADALSEKAKVDRATTPVAPVSRLPVESKKYGLTKKEYWTPGKPKLPREQREIKVKAYASNSGVDFNTLKWEKFHEAGVKTSQLATLLGLAEDSSPVIPENSPGSAKKKNQSSPLGLPR